MPISVASPRSGSRLLAPLRQLVREALALEGARPGEIAIVLTDDAQLRELNRRYRGIDRATDVLSFAYEEVEAGAEVRAEAPQASRRRARGSRNPALAPPRRLRSAIHGSAQHASAAGKLAVPPRSGGAVQRSTPPPVSGDLVISLDRLRAQAKRYRVSEGKELARLVVHGALHLAGLDHHRAGERAHMRRQEQRAMRTARELVGALDRAVAAAGGLRGWR